MTPDFMVGTGIGAIGVGLGLLVSKFITSLREAKRNARIDAEFAVGYPLSKTPCVMECTRQLPHICKVNGPCNGWPRPYGHNASAPAGLVMPAPVAIPQPPGTKRYPAPIDSLDV